MWLWKNYTELIPHRILFINRNLSICHLESIDYFQSDSSCGEAKGIGIHNSWFPRGGCGLCLPVFMSVCLCMRLFSWHSSADCWLEPGGRGQGRSRRASRHDWHWRSLRTRRLGPSGPTPIAWHMALALLCCTVLENYIHDDQCE